MDFDKLRARRTILQRTKTKAELPRLVLYMEWVGGTAQRKVLDEEQKEHVLDDKVVQSYYKVVTKTKAKDLLKTHWPEIEKERLAAASAGDE